MFWTWTVVALAWVVFGDSFRHLWSYRKTLRAEDLWWRVAILAIATCFGPFLTLMLLNHS